MGRRAVVPERLQAVMSDGARHCWTLDELHDGLRTAGHDADPSTIFRALGRLEAQGVVRTVSLDGRRGRYELAGEHHEHLVCEGCGAIEAVPCGLVAAWADQVRRECGFEVEGHQLVLRGRCRRCRAGQDSAPRTSARRVRR
jgi:Fur family ferric uptake transcriptional regulator